MRHGVMILATWVLGLGSFAMAQESLNYRVISVFVIDEVGLSTQHLADAESNAAYVFRQAGVKLDWVNCERRSGTRSRSACPREVDAEDFVVRIVSRARTLSSDAFGVSFLTDDVGRHADIFFTPIEELHSVNRQLSMTAILGNVVAHELGHLLLGSNAHSPNGIMQPRWTPEQLKKLSSGSLRFTSEQAQRLRAGPTRKQQENRPGAVLEALNR